MSDPRDRIGFPNRQAELQFQYDARYHERLRAAPWLKALQSGRASSNAVGHVYFDTPDKELQRHGVMLRVDRKGKGAPALPPLAQLRDLPEFRKVLSKRVFDSLAPVFSTRIKRTTRRLKPSEGAEVALAFERLEVSASRHQSASPILFCLERGENLRFDESPQNLDVGQVLVSLHGQLVG